jgi:hypothetical protein
MSARSWELLNGCLYTDLSEGVRARKSFTRSYRAAGVQVRLYRRAVRAGGYTFNVFAVVARRRLGGAQ